MSVPHYVIDPPSFIEGVATIDAFLAFLKKLPSSLPEVVFAKNLAKKERTAALQLAKLRGE